MIVYNIVVEFVRNTLYIYPGLQFVIILRAFDEF
jgi:hypothetical protein